MPEAPQRSGYIDEQINEAIARGDFDNLNGKGRPLHLRGDLSKAAEMREKLRGDANFGAPWVEVGREIELATRRAETELCRALEFRRAGLDAPKADKFKIEADFRAALRNLETQISGVNSLILKHNLVLPPQLPQLHRVRLRLEHLVKSVAPELEAVILNRAALEK